jgi:acyl dehydratase
LAGTLAIGAAERVDVVVDLDAARSFARATDDDADRIVDGSPVPAFYGVVATGPSTKLLYDRLFGEDDVVVHLASDSHFHRPVFIGQPFAAVTEITGIQPTALGTFFYQRNALFDADGTATVESFSTLLIPGERDFLEQGAAPPDVRIDGLQRRRTRTRHVIVPSETHSQFYAESTDDWQKIHFEDDAAKAIGLQGPIMHGGTTIGMCGAIVTEALCDGDPTRLSRLAMRLTTPIYPGSRMVVEISEPLETEARTAHAIKVLCDGRPVARGGRADVRR